MNHQKWIASCVAVGMIATLLPPAAPPVHAATATTISPYSTYATNNGVFEGWGTSLCWWANRLGYSDTLAQQAADSFFGDEGLRMNIMRFNIGGGDDPSHTHITRTDSNMPGYTVYQNGQARYDWNADANQRNVLQRSIQAAGEDAIVEMFSNSPPYYMTNSGCSTGSKDAGSNNLRNDCYDDFAAYLAEVCAHYEKEWGVSIQSIDAMNEPYTNFWGAYSPKQEGCHFDIGDSESKIILELQAALAQRGLSNIMLCGTDETAIDTQITAFNALSPAAKQALGRIDTHTYGGSKRAELRDLAVANQKQLWMSEVDGNGTAGTNAGEMSAALWLAERMAGDCNGLNCSAWVLWQAIDNHISAVGYNGNQDKGMVNTSGGFWGLAVADHDNNRIILTKKYYAFGQYSRYIRPGYLMLNSGGSNVAAFDPESGRLVIVIPNTSGSAREVSYDLSQFQTVGSTVQTIRTSGSMANGENWKDVGDIATSGGGFTASLAPNSVTTFLIDGMEAATLTNNKIPVTAEMLSGSDAWNQSANTYQKVIDGNNATFFDGVGDGWVQIDLGARYTLDAITFAPRSGYEYRCVDASIYGSLDGVNWEKLHTISATPASGTNFVTKFDGDATVQYVKYAVPTGAPSNPSNPDNVYCCNLAEIALYGALEAKKEGKKGDVNCDGDVDIADVILLNRFIAEDRDVSITEQGLRNAACSGGTTLSSSDATLIMKWLARLIPTL